jgi:hypothetical protein
MSASVIATTGMAGVTAARTSTVNAQAPDARLQNVRKEAATTQDVMSQRCVTDWDPANFAAEQIRGLVRQVFFSSETRHVRQVVFSAVDADTDVRAICRRVGEALTLETAEKIAVVGAYPKVVADADDPPQTPEIDRASILRRHGASRLRGNLWLVPSEVSRAGAPTASLHSLVCDLRREFEFSIVEAPPACESNSAAAMAQLADGIVLVLSASRTRRHAARKTKEILEAAQARVLGLVLTDRPFPIPAKIYRWL